ncbi:2757_t:CDS:2, partial [Funneliformis caledonium]
ALQLRASEIHFEASADVSQVTEVPREFTSGRVKYSKVAAYGKRTNLPLSYLANLLLMQASSLGIQELSS